MICENLMVSVVFVFRFNFDFFLNFVMFACFNFVLVCKDSMISVLITLALGAYKYMYPDHTVFSRVDPSCTQLATTVS